MASSSQHAYCTLLMTDSYLPGAMVLAHSLRDSGTKKQLVALVTLDSISANAVETLKTVYDQIIPVNKVVNKSPANLYLMGRADLAATFTKINLWRLVQFDRLVFIDADAVALRASDELFELNSKLAAVPDVGWPDCFNSGVLALTPNMGDYYALSALARNGVSFDGADQGLLNTHFPPNNWERLSFRYNCTPSGNYQYAPAYRHFGSTIHMIHFIGRDKPWLVGRGGNGAGGVYQELAARWWAVHDAHMQVNDDLARQEPAMLRAVQQDGFDEANGTTLDYSTKAPDSVASSSKSTNDGVSSNTEVKSSLESIGTTASFSEQPNNHEQRVVVEEIVEEPKVFLAPQTEWDPARQAPPPQSRPEASNFPTQQYEMSADLKLWKPPQSYPEPPKNIYYEIPKVQPQTRAKPKKIFPWEENQAPATRVFPEDEEPSSDVDSQAQIEKDVSMSNAENGTSKTNAPPIIHVSDHQPFKTYVHTNAWDDIPAIDRHVRSLGIFTFHNGGRKSSRQDESRILNASSSNEKEANRRPSFKITDFPTADERPSLPVTPNPVRRSSFWGTDQDDSKLAVEDDAPSQPPWDPHAKLDELVRRHSLIIEEGLEKLKDLPRREFPENAQPTATATMKEPLQESSTWSARILKASIFLQPDQITLAV